MKTLLEIFPRASKSFQEANPVSSGRDTPKNDLQATVGGKKRDFMNKTEAEYSLILEARKQKGEIIEWKYEAIKLRLGDGCWYVPDFFVIAKEMFVPLDPEIPWPVGQFGRDYHVVKFIEVKGFLRDDARVKFLAAQEIHKWASFEMWSKNKSGWTQML